MIVPPFPFPFCLNLGDGYSITGPFPLTGFRVLHNYPNFSY